MQDPVISIESITSAFKGFFLFLSLSRFLQWILQEVEEIYLSSFQEVVPPIVFWASFDNNTEYGLKEYGHSFAQSAVVGPKVTVLRQTHCLCMIESNGEEGKVQSIHVPC